MATNSESAVSAPIRRASPEPGKSFAVPHRPVFAICSDLDETPDADTYFELMRFLNTTEETRMGRGVGLEVGNTIYFDMAPGQFSYWNCGDADRERIRALIRSGHIDCIHSFGDLATTRAHAGRALDELAKHDCHIKVWVDHAQAVTNLGADIMRGHGDEPGHPAYHADLTVGYGIKYMWRGRVTSVIGQDRPFSLRSIAAPEQRLGSAKTIAKELAKQVLACAGNRKYGLHRGNTLMRPRQLRDGQVLPEFIRSNPCWAGVDRHDRGDAIHAVITRRYLDRLVQRGGYSILYAHLGKNDRGESPRAFGRQTVEAFRLLAEYHHGGKIHITTTARLLDLYQTRHDVVDAAAVNDSKPLRFPNI